MIWKIGFALFLFSALGHAGESSLFNTDIVSAFKQAKKLNRPLLIDFFGSWCPPCLQMDETVFNTPKFFQKSKAFVLLRVDVDTEASWALKDKFHINAYPTIIFTNPQGEEIDRVVGYRDPESFYKTMDENRPARVQSYESACASSSVEALWRCASVCSDRKDHACARTAFRKLENKLPPGSIRYQLARAYFVENADNEDLKRNGYEKLLADYPTSPLAVSWALDYLKVFQTQKKMRAKRELVERALLNSPTKLDEAGMTETDAMEMRAELLENVGKKAEAQTAWLLAAERLAKMAQDLPPGVSNKGFVTEEISCLENAGQVEKALALANEYRAQYPKDFLFHFKTASILDRSKRYNDALPIAKQAFDASYGDNRIRVAILLVNLYATVPNKAAAKEIYQKVTREQTPNTKLEVRTFDYLKKLDSAWQKVNAI